MHEIFWWDHSIQQYFHMMLFVLYAVLTSESVDKSPLCERSNETHLAELLNNTIKYFLGF